MQKKFGRGDQNVVSLRANRGRRKGKFRQYSGRAKLALILTALLVGLIYNSEGIIADLTGWEQPEIFGKSRPDLSGRVTHVRDADTIEVSGVAVRIANLDCAERGTTAGERATERMRQLVTLGPFSCYLEGRQSYDREVGTCHLADGRDVGEILIEERQCGRWY